MPNRQVSNVIESQGFVSVSAKTSVREVAQVMKEHHVSAVMVVGRRHTLVGVCAERDVVNGVVAAGLDPDQTEVASVMTEHPQTIAPDKPFGHALHLMYEGGFHHVPVVDDVGRPVGIVCASDAQRMDALQLERELIQREEITVIL